MVEYFSESVDKSKVSFKADKHNGYHTLHEDPCTSVDKSKVSFKADKHNRYHTLHEDPCTSVISR